MSSVKDERFMFKEKRGVAKPYMKMLGLATSVLREELTGACHFDRDFREADSEKLQTVLDVITRKFKTAMVEQDSETVSLVDLNEIAKAYKKLTSFVSVALNANGIVHTEAEENVILELAEGSKICYHLIKNCFLLEYKTGLPKYSVRDYYFILLAAKICILGSYFVENKSLFGMSGIAIFPQPEKTGPLSPQFNLLDEITKSPNLKSIAKEFKVSPKSGNRRVTNFKNYLQGLNQPLKPFSMAVRKKPAENQSLKKGKKSILDTYSPHKAVFENVLDRIEPKSFPQVFLEANIAKNVGVKGELTMARKKDSNKVSNVLAYAIEGEPVSKAVVLYENFKLEFLDIKKETMFFSVVKEIRLKRLYIPGTQGCTPASGAPLGNIENARVCLKNNLAYLSLEMCYNYTSIFVYNASTFELVSAKHLKGWSISATHRSFHFYATGHDSGLIKVWKDVNDASGFELEERALIQYVPSTNGISALGRVKFLASDESSSLVAVYDVYNDLEDMGIYVNYLVFHELAADDSFNTYTFPLETINDDQMNVSSLLVQNGEVYLGTSLGTIIIIDLESREKTFTIENAHFGLRFAPRVKKQKSANLRTIVSKNESVITDSMFQDDETASQIEHQVKSRFQLKRLTSRRGDEDRRRKQPVTSLALQNNLLVSTGAEGNLKVWDLTSPFADMKPTMLPKVATEFQPVISAQSSDSFIYFLCISKVNVILCRYMTYGLETLAEQNANNALKTASSQIKRAHTVSQPLITGRFLEDMGTINISRRFKSTNDEKLPPPTMEQICSNKKRLKQFRKFLRTRAAAENLDFYIDANRYKTKFGKSPKSLMIREGNVLLRRYIQPGSVQEINIPADIRDQLMALEAENFTRAVFNDALFEVEDLIETNFIHEFLAHEATTSPLASPTQADASKRNISMASLDFV
eukprot:snap_masked-scaffold_1-processed-gene-22.22-mRNA-1 protein AED:1.00 eAED:1.00 QI:0/0/0/0/1/1/2/0/923